MFVSVRPAFLSLAMLMIGGGCTSHATQQPQTAGATGAENGRNSQATSLPSGPKIDAGAVSARLHAIATAGKLADLRWPDFSDYQLHFQHVYDTVNFAPVWVRDGQPTLQALGVIQELDARSHLPAAQIQQCPLQAHLPFRRKQRAHAFRAFLEGEGKYGWTSIAARTA